MAKSSIGCLEREDCAEMPFKLRFVQQVSGISDAIELAEQRRGIGLSSMPVASFTGGRAGPSNLPSSSTFKKMLERFLSRQSRQVCCCRAGASPRWISMLPSVLVLPR